MIVNLNGYASGAKMIQGLGIVLGSTAVIGLYPLHRKSIRSDTHKVAMYMTPFRIWMV